MERATHCQNIRSKSTKCNLVATTQLGYQSLQDAHECYKAHDRVLSAISVILSDYSIFDSYLCEYSSRLEHARTMSLLAAWHRAVAQDELFAGASFNLDFHSVPYYGEDAQIERHYVSMRSRAQPSVLAFLAQDAQGRAFCYSNADLRKGEEAEEIFRFIEFWKKHHGELPRHLVFDSRLTTYANLARLDGLGITFITLRRRSAKLLAEIEALPASSWRRVSLDVPARKFKTPRVFEQPVTLAGATLRQLFVLDLGHEEPTILLTNDRHSTQAKLLTRYAQRMLIENALSDAVRFFHMDALSSAVGLKVDVDMALLVIASGLYRLLARRMRGLRRRAGPSHLSQSHRHPGRCHRLRARGPRALPPPRPPTDHYRLGTPRLARARALVERLHVAHECVAETKNRLAVRPITERGNPG